MSAQINFQTTTMPCLRSRPDISNGDDEAALVSNARNGCSASVQQLVSLYERRLFRLALNITGNHEDAEEVVQNAFVKAFGNLAVFRGDSRFYTWIVRIALNEALMKIRGNRFQSISIDESQETEHGFLPRELHDWGPNPEQRYSQEELRGILETTINKLEPGYRIVFQLRDVEGLSGNEAAEALHLSLSAVKTRLQRARFKLRDSLDAYFRPGTRVNRRLSVRRRMVGDSRPVRQSRKVSSMAMKRMRLHAI